jgi:hypothetical protein
MIGSAKVRPLRPLRPFGAGDRGLPQKQPYGFKPTFSMRALAARMRSSMQRS